VTLNWASFLEWHCLSNTGLENFEGLNAYKKLVRKELLNTVRTNRVDLDTLVFVIRHLVLCASRLRVVSCLIASVRVCSNRRRLRFAGRMIERSLTVKHKAIRPCAYLRVPVHDEAHNTPLPRAASRL
jgi:hypothetical protein